jgi:hypothetical protein
MLRRDPLHAVLKVASWARAESIHRTQCSRLVLIQERDYIWRRVMEFRRNETIGRRRTKVIGSTGCV